MFKIDERTVELSSHEMRANDYFNLLLDDGYGIRAAIDKVKEKFLGLTDEFYDWLAN